MKKKIFSLVLALALVAAGASLAVATGLVEEIKATLDPTLKIVIDGEVQSFEDVNGKEVYPVVYNGTTYLPLRAIGNLMDKKVEWDGENYTAILGDPEYDLRPEFKLAMDRYEVCNMAYFELVNAAKADPDNEEYAQMLTDAVDSLLEITAEYRAWAENDLSRDETKYYYGVEYRVKLMTTDLAFAGLDDVEE